MNPWTFLLERISSKLSMVYGKRKKTNPLIVSTHNPKNPEVFQLTKILEADSNMKRVLENLQKNKEQTTKSFT
jgi:hypothetical protein